VLPQCPVLSKLYLGGNQIGDEGARMLAGVLPQCPVLSELYLDVNQIGHEGAGMLAGVLPQCPALSYLHLTRNQIGAEAADRLRAWNQFASCCDLHTRSELKQRTDSEQSDRS